MPLVSTSSIIKGVLPFVRIKLNEELAQNRLLPLEIVVTGKVSQKSTHRITTGLNEVQKKRVAEVANMLQHFATPIGNPSPNSAGVQTLVCAGVQTLVCGNGSFPFASH